MKRIRNRIFVQLLIPILFVYVIVIGGGIKYMGVSFQENSIARKEVALTNIVRGIDDWLLSRISEIVQLSTIPLFNTGDTRAIHQYMHSWLQRLSFLYDQLYLIEEDNSYWSTDGSTGIMNDTNYPSLFFKENAILKYAGPHRFGSVFEEHFIIGMPIYNTEESVKQILTATIKLETLGRIFGYFTFDEFDSWMIVNPYSIIITHNEKEMVGLSERGEYGRVFLETEQWNDKQVFVQVMRNGWKVVAFINTDKLIVPYRQAYLLIWGFSVFLFIFLIGFTLILSSSVTHPIRQLTEGVHRIMAGDYTKVISLQTEDELHDLADSFNRLTSRMTTIRTDDRFAFLGHFAARMAHELRKPLHLIQLSSQALSDEPQKRDYYNMIIRQEIENADRFISEILNFVHSEPVDKQLYPLENLLHAMMEKYRIITKHNNITLLYTKKNRIPEIYIDVLRIEEVLSNILQNAIDSIIEAATEPEKREIAVTILCSQEKEIEIHFIDSGPGFDDECMDQLFDPYFTTRDKGTGLGLAVCYRIMMAHGGYINLANTEEHHGSVVLTFPI